MEKREVSVLIPYKVKDGNIFVFLQKRADDAKILPGYFAFFGGKIEVGESPDQALKREIQEELGFVVRQCEFLGKYPFKDNKYVAHVYFLEVGDNFENEIKIMEGDYGKFFSEAQMTTEPMMLDSDKSIVKDLYQLLSKKYDGK